MPEAKVRRESASRATPVEIGLNPSDRKSESRPEDSAIPKRWELALIALIVLNVAAVVVESVREIGERYADFFRWFEVASVTVFSIEYVTRLVLCVRQPEYRRPVVGRIRWASTPLAIIDVVAILPFFLTSPTDLRMLRIARLSRLLRLLKITRYSRSIQTLGTVIRAKKEDLLVTVGAIALLLVVSSSLMYFAESEAQPEGFSSIPAAMWWGVCTLTTVGYGDLYPITPVGKVLGALIAILGVGLFALPAGILAAGFTEYLGGGTAGRCPRCGHAGADGTAAGQREST